MNLFPWLRNRNPQTEVEPKTIKEIVVETKEPICEIVPREIVVECFELDLDKPHGVKDKLLMKLITLDEWVAQFNPRVAWAFKFIFKINRPDQVLIIIGPLNHADLLEQSIQASCFAEIVGGGHVDGQIINSMPRFYFSGKSWDYGPVIGELKNEDFAALLKKTLENILGKEILFEHRFKD